MKYLSILSFGLLCWSISGESVAPNTAAPAAQTAPIAPIGGSRSGIRRSLAPTMSSSPVPQLSVAPVVTVAPSTRVPPKPVSPDFVAPLFTAAKRTPSPTITYAPVVPTTKPVTQPPVMTAPVVPVLPPSYYTYENLMIPLPPVVEVTAAPMTQPPNVTESPATTVPVLRGNGTTISDEAPRIVGGSPVTNDGRFPYFTRVTVRSVDSNNVVKTTLCGGTLISRLFVLTAAHCLDRANIDQVILEIGRIDMTSDGTFETRRSNGYAIHPAYGIGVTDDDIAIIRLANPSQAEPAIIPFGETMFPKTSDTVTVLGFGKTSATDTTNDQLRRVSVDVRPRNECDVFTSNFRIGYQFCAGGNGKVPCNGDSGGPALAGDVIAGIVSFGSDGCFTSPAVFTRVSAYTDFIRMVACDASTNQPDWCSARTSPGSSPGNLNGSNANFCFSGSSMVQVEHRGFVPMQQLRLRDRVHIGNNVYEPIYSFGHWAPETEAMFLDIDTAHSKLRVTPEHMVYTKTNGFVRASLLQVGDDLWHSSGVSDRIVHIRSVRERGLYAPFTPSGKIMVNDILASSYVALEESYGLDVFFGLTTLSHQWLSHAIQFPHRFVCARLEQCPTEEYTLEGISVWVVRPMMLGQWFLQQRGVIRIVFTILLVLTATILVLVEALVLHPSIALTVCVLLSVIVTILPRLRLKVKQS